MTVPITWATTGKQLSDYITPVVPIPNGKSIQMNEAIEAISPREVMFNSEVESQALITYVVNSEAITDPILMPILTKSILGGYYSTDGTLANGKRYTPLKHPYLDLYAKNMRCAWAGLDDNSATDNYQKYGVCRLDVSYDSLPYLPKYTNISAPVNMNNGWLEITQRNTNKRINTPLGWYTIPYNNAAFPAMGGYWTTQPMSYIDVMYHQIPYAQLFTTDDQWKLTNSIGGQDGATVQLATFGNINSDTFSGYQPESLMLDAVNVRVYRDWLGQKMVAVHMVLLRNGWGFNRTLGPDGKLYPMTLLATPGLKPFLNISFQFLANAINNINGS